MENLFEKICREKNLEAAYERVAENAGCRGSDGVSVYAFGDRLHKNLRTLWADLESGRYHPYPLLRFPIAKKKRNEKRWLSVPAVRDRVAQTAVFLITAPIFEAEFENVSHAYRQGRGVRSAVYQVRDYAKQGYRYAMDADIDDYFDNIDHELLLQKLARLLPAPPLLRLFRKWIKAEVYDGERIYTLQKGIPQGSVVSPHLANLFLDELDETLVGFGMKLVRYADDFLVLCKSTDEAQNALELTDMLLEDMKLDLNPLKTKIVSFDRGFKFLGAIFMRDGVYLPFPEKRAGHGRPTLPPRLTLKRYLELRGQSVGA